jgi:choline transport protein
LQVHPTLRLPVNALALVGVIVFLLAIIFIPSATAFNAIISMQAMAVHISYVFPILFIVLRKIRGQPVGFGPFQLGRLGIPVNIFALCYLVYVIIWMPFPTVLPVTGTNMNYAGPVVGIVIIGALLDWIISGRKRFDVPVAPVLA